LRGFCRTADAFDLAERLTEKLGGAKIYLKREDLLHTGAHKINKRWGRYCWRSGWGKSGHRGDGRGTARRGDGDRGGAIRF